MFPYKLPEGFDLKIKNGYGVFDRRVYFQIYNTSNKNYIGGIHLKPYYHLFSPTLSRFSYETHSDLALKYHGKGLGAFLYGAAIQWCHDHRFIVHSAINTSELAQRVWQGRTLHSHFRIRKYFHPRFQEPYQHRWYAYPK